MDIKKSGLVVVKDKTMVIKWNPSNAEKAPTAGSQKKYFVSDWGKACFEGLEIKLHDRVAWHGDEIGYWSYKFQVEGVKIAKDGGKLLDNPPDYF